MYLRQSTVIIKYGYFMEISLGFHQIHGAETLWMDEYAELAHEKGSQVTFFKNQQPAGRSI